MTKDSHRNGLSSRSIGPRALPTQNLSEYTWIPAELLIATLTLAPIIILAYSYSLLPERIPVFLNLRGEVEVWAAKSIVSVFRVPAMAADLQILCLLMKYGVVKSNSALRVNDVEMYRQYQRRATSISARLWDWLRCLIAFKMTAESLDILSLDDKRLRFLKTPAWAVPRIAAILSIAGALFYGYRLLMVQRERKKAVGHNNVENQIDRAHLYGGILYYNQNDPTLFLNKYLFNFANKWLYVLFACVIAYPLLVFSTFL